jgi:hypothetical protein
MRTELWQLIDAHGYRNLSNELRAEITKALQDERDELMRECAERKAEREAKRRKSP